MSTIDKDYQYCEAVIKQHSKSFYYGFKQLPENDAKAVYAVYAFCRMADDMVDQKGSVQYRKAELDRLSNQFTQFEQGLIIDQPMWRALADVRYRYPLEISAFKMQLAGQQMDLVYTQPETMADLERYSKYVAGSVGRMLLPILSEDVTLELKQNAEKLGVGCYANY